MTKKEQKHIKRFKRQEEIDNKSLLEKKRKTEHDNSLVADLEKFLEISDDECEPKGPHDEDYECSIYSPHFVSDQSYIDMA